MMAGSRNFVDMSRSFTNLAVYKAENEAKRAKDEAETRTRAVLAHKERVRAARLIQRAYRVRLYAPPDGAMYLRAMGRFRAATDTSL